MITDLVFWFVLVASVTAYWLLPAHMRLAVLSLASLAFIAYVAPESAALLLLLAMATWLALPLIARQSGAAASLAIGVIAITVGPLIAFKITSYYGVPWLDGSIMRYAVPLGMSYYAFRLIHVVIDAYRFGERPTDPVTFFCYAFLFTIFVAGPIQRYDDFIAHRTPTFDGNLIRDGLTRILMGLLKQGVVVEGLSSLRRGTLGKEFHLLHGETLLAAPVGSIWLLLLFAYLIAYLNLGAYSDVAIGASRLFGFRISENFHYPVAARNLSDFWRRWHMTLSGWCQTYIFSPVLGLTRRPYIALIASFQVMGLWHLLTLNRVGWGLFQATGLITLYAFRQYARKRDLKLDKALWWAVVAWSLTQTYATLGFLFVIEEANNDLLLTLRILLRVVTFGVLS